MYDFHYNFIKNHFGAEMLFTDTDSFTCEIKSEDIYEEFFKHKHLFDFSNYPKDSKLLDQATKSVIDKIKDESEGKIIDEFVWIKFKNIFNAFHMMIKNLIQEKGGNIATEFSEFKDTLFDKKVLRQKMRRIQIKNHKLGTYEVNKTSLLCFDDKKLVLDDGIHTLAYFHKEFKEKSSHK